jgi:hypothetical protein
MYARTLDSGKEENVMSGKISVGWKNLAVVGLLALGIGVVHPTDAAAQVPSVSTKLNYINSTGAFGEIEPLQFENALTVSPRTGFLLTDLVLTNDGDLATSARILDAEEGEFPSDARARTPCFVVPAADTVVISLVTAIDFAPEDVVQVQNCSATGTALEYWIRGYNVKFRKSN